MVFIERGLSALSSLTVYKLFRIMPQFSWITTYTFLFFLELLIVFIFSYEIMLNAVTITI